MKKKVLFILLISILFFVILWILGLVPAVHKFNLYLIELIISLF